MSIGNSLAKGLTKQIGRSHQDTRKASLDHTINQLSKPEASKSRKIWFRNINKLIRQLFGDALIESSSMGTGKQAKSTYIGLFWPTFDDPNDPYCFLALGYVDARSFDYEVRPYPIMLSKHGIQRLIQSADTKDLGELSAFIRPHIMAMMECFEEGGYDGHNVLIYCDNGVSIWVVGPTEDHAGIIMATLKTFIRADSLEGFHARNYQRIDQTNNDYYHTSYPIKETSDESRH